MAFVHIRDAEQTDFSELVPLLSELGYEISEEAFTNQANTYINSGECALLVAETEDGTISGLIAGHLFPLIHQPGNAGRIMGLVVRSEFQGSGIGVTLLESLEGWFRENKCLRFEVNSGDHREKAHEFYQSNGYQVDERRFVKTNAP